jgi:hypothetical protein
MVNPKLTGHSLSAPSVELRYNPQALIMTIRSFHEGHRAVEDCHADGTDGRPKSWWVEVDEQAFDTELTFLRREIYRREVEPYTQRITPFERFKLTR